MAADCSPRATAGTLQMLRSWVEDFDTAHVAGICAVVVSARQPNWHLRNTGAATSAGQCDANIVNIGGARTINDVNGAAESVAGRGRLGGNWV